MKRPTPTLPTKRQEADDEEESSSRTKVLLGILAGLAAIGLIGWFFSGGTTGSVVSGTVSLEGTPLASADLYFIGQGANKDRFQAKSQENGRYTLRSNTNAGVPPGEYKITVSKVALPDGSLPAREDFEKAMRTGKLKNIIDKQYETPETTPLRVVVKEGSLTHNIELKKQP